MGASSKSSSEDYAPMAEINITPFVDVMLVLLVIFMVTAPLMETGIGVQLPKASGKALPQNEAPVVLHVTKDRELYLDKNRINPSDLIRALQAYFKGREKKEIFIRADGSLAYEYVAQTMAAVKLAGIEKLGLVTLPEEAEKATQKK